MALRLMSKYVSLTMLSIKPEVRFMHLYSRFFHLHCAIIDKVKDDEVLVIILED